MLCQDGEPEFETIHRDESRGLQDPLPVLYLNSAATFGLHFGSTYKATLPVYCKGKGFALRHEFIAEPLKLFGAAFGGDDGPSFYRAKNVLTKSGLYCNLTNSVFLSSYL